MKKIIIIGATSGIGLEVARCYLKDGWQVGVAGRREEELEKQRGKGHIAVISSIAGTKGLGSAPAYSATKRFQNTYINALEQLAHMKKLNISFTDIRPGFVATPLLKDDKYPLLMHTSQVASQIVKAISRRKRVAIIDWRYQFIVFFWKLIPGWLWVRLPVRNQ